MFVRLFLTNLAGFFSWQPGRVRIRFFFQNPARKKNPAGQEYEIPAEKNSCRDFLVIPAGISCRAAGKNGPRARLLRNGLIMFYVLMFYLLEEPAGGVYI
jgi:hypothetical protein